MKGGDLHAGTAQWAAGPSPLQSPAAVAIIKDGQVNGFVPLQQETRAVVPDL